MNSQNMKYFKIRKAITSLFSFLLFAVSATSTFAQTQDRALPYYKVKKMSLEELMNVEITSISMRPEKLTEVASAVQVITGEDIHRSGATRLPEALRLASNLQISQSNSHDWAITSRGFNGLPSAGGVLANKLLVMIDGRSVYSPLYGGVFWDVQNIMLANIDHIEVVSGPGGTLWGANAVNGVINVIRKSAKETQGLYISGAAGSLLQDEAEVRYGFKLDSNIFCHVYGQRFDQKHTVFVTTGKDAKDAWTMSKGGFRMDYYSSVKNTLTLSGDFYAGVENDSVKHAVTDGQNVLAHFTHIFSERSDLNIKTYYDRTWRIASNSLKPFSYNLNTYHIEIEHHFPVGKRQNILWGGTYRLQQDKVASGFNPLSRDMPLYSVFVQDEIVFVPNLLKFTLGSKFLNNIFSGFEVHPCARLAWTPNQRHTIWTSVSRAVRMPSRFDVDVTVTPVKFDSEKVIAYELGYRMRPANQWLLAFSTFYNQYTQLRSLDSNASTTVPIILANSQRAESWGFEFSGTFQATEWWRLRAGYTYFEKTISPTSLKVLPISEAFEGVDPKNQFMLQSILDISKSFQFDVIGRYVDVLPTIAAILPSVPSYVTFDVRLAYKLKPFEISIVGQNLLEDKHTEAGSSIIPRSAYARVTCQF